MVGAGAAGAAYVRGRLAAGAARSGSLGVAGTAALGARKLQRDASAAMNAGKSVFDQIRGGPSVEWDQKTMRYVKTREFEAKFPQTASLLRRAKINNLARSL